MRQVRKIPGSASTDALGQVLLVGGAVAHCTRRAIHWVAVGCAVLVAVVLVGCSSPPLGVDPSTEVDSSREAGIDVSVLGAGRTPALDTSELADRLDGEVLDADAGAGLDVLGSEPADTGRRDASELEAAPLEAGAPEDAATDGTIADDALPQDAGPGDASDGAVGREAGDRPCVPASCGTHSWACWPMPNSGPGGLPHPARYTDMGDGTVRDDVTCLLWEQNPVSSMGYNGSDSRVHCSQSRLLQGTGWRLPTRIELISILDYSRVSPAVAVSFFPKIQLNPPYWTSSAFGNILGTRYQIRFYDGTLSYADESGVYLAWCVRGGGESPDLPAAAPPNHYAIGISEAADNYTGLVWQRADSRSLTTAGLTAAEAAVYCETLSLDGVVWRLPSVKELATLVDETRLGLSVPVIDAMAFPLTESGNYWTSTTIQGRTWALDFATGLHSADKTLAHVRCVH